LELHYLHPDGVHYEHKTNLTNLMRNKHEQIQKGVLRYPIELN